ncbi:MAG: hypothetical protein ACLSDJ_12230, partial [Butyricimonas faecihominis]
TGAYTGKLKVPCPVVGKRVDLRCVADVLPDLTGVNLISKAMISDDWDAIKAGISTPGEDSDGKYLAIDVSLLYVTFKRGTEDIFGGKIKYKPNQRYRLSVKWKLQGEQEHSGLTLTTRYTDGSGASISLPSNQTKTMVSSLITSTGKTIARITSSYGINTYQTNLYDIQLVEWYGAPRVGRGLQENPGERGGRRQRARLVSYKRGDGGVIATRGKSHVIDRGREGSGG